MLSNNDIKAIEQIISYEFNNKDLLVKLFNNPTLQNHDAYENGLNKFEEFIAKECDNKIFDINDYYKDLNHGEKILYNHDLFESDENNNFYSSLNKIGLTKYLNFDEKTTHQEIYRFVFNLFNAIAVDSNNDWQKLATAINKITLYKYVLYYPNFEYDKLDLQFAFRSYQCKHAIMQIYCPKFLTYSHQEANDTFNYLAYYYVDLLQKTTKDFPQLENIWAKANFEDDELTSFEKIAKENDLNIGYLYLQDEYYWYCLVFISKFDLAFFAKSEKKEEAKQFAINAFIKHYAHLDNQDEGMLTYEGKAVDVTMLFFNMLYDKLNLHHYDCDKMQTFNWNSAHVDHLIHQLDECNINSLQIYQRFANDTNCLLFVKNLPQAFSTNGKNETDALINASALLIKHFLH